MRDEEEMCKESLRNEDSGVRKSRKEVIKRVRKEGLKFGSGQDPYPLYLKVSEGN
jgi:hypothetical protein